MELCDFKKKDMYFCVCILMSNSQREKCCSSKSYYILLNYISNCSKKDFIAESLGVLSVMQYIYFFCYSIIHSLWTNNDCIYRALPIFSHMPSACSIEEKENISY